MAYRIAAAMIEPITAAIPPFINKSENVALTTLLTETLIPKPPIKVEEFVCDDV